MSNRTHDAKAMTRRQIDEYLAALERRVPALMQDMNVFYGKFEACSDKLVAGIDTEDLPYVDERLERIIARSGVNA